MYAFTFMQSSPFKNYYIVFEGTMGETRAKMHSIFGEKWAFQYSWEEFVPQIARFNLREIRVLEGPSENGEVKYELVPKP